MADNEKDQTKNRHGLTPKELREAGDAEVAMWTITKPGGKPMTLKQHGQARNDHTERQRIFDDGMARDQAEREQAHKDFHGEDLPAGAGDDADGDDGDG